MEKAGNNVGIIDTTVRDGQQSLWATRMTTSMMLPILSTMDRMGFHTIECMGTAVMDSCVRWLRENPWERLRLIKERVPNTPLGMISIAMGFSVGKGAIPDDITELLFERCAVNGIDHFFIMDGLNDMRNFEVTVKAIHGAGKKVLGGVTYSISPVHTDEHFVEKTKDLVALGVDIIVLKDPNGILTPERIRTLVPAMREAAGHLPLFCHSHCSTGLGPATNLEAVKYGVDGIWTAAAPLANGSSLPSTGSMVRHIERMGYSTGVDQDGLDAIAEHFRQVALRHDKPIGKPAEYDPFLYEHQMPGGMISNFRAQLAQLGIEERLQEVFEEIPRVREELGWSLMVTPFSQVIGTQAALNVLYGRYEVVLEEVEKLVLGLYGRTPGPVDPDVLDRAGRGKEPITERPASLLPLVVEQFRKEQGPFESDEDLLLHYIFMPDQLKALHEAGPMPLEDRMSTASGLVALVREVAKSKDVREFRLIQR